MKIKYFILLFLSFLLLSQVAKTQNLLNLRITIHVQNTTVGEILKDIEKQGNFFFAYNPDNIDQTKTVSLSARDIKVRDALKELFQHEATFQQVENHIIINSTPKSEAKNSFQITGHIANSSDAPLDSAIVYDPENEKLVISKKDGSFAFDFDTNDKNISLFVRLRSYKDTVIYVTPGNQRIDLRLQRREPSPTALTPIGTEDAELKLKDFENLSLVQRLVPPEAIYASSNLNTEKIMPVQFSFLPKAGTNSFVKGLRVNHASFNILAGYSKGLSGAEFGGIANIIQKEAKGFQAAGIANVVLGDVHGTQFSGIYTMDLSNVHGFQVSGVYNSLRGTISGGQISGVSNIAMKTVNGAQVAGVFNVAKGKVTGAQVSGVINIDKDDVAGVEITGVANISKKTVRGLQLAGLYNESSEINGLQLSSLINLNRNKTQGVQITTILNTTKALNGLQFGLVNIADTINTGFQVGLINIVKHGKYSLEFSHNETFPIDFNFKTGNPRLYSIINLTAGNNKLGFGYGLGSNFPLNKKFTFWTDASSTSIHDSKKLTTQGLKLTMRHGLNYDLFKHISLRGGISENYFIPQKSLKKTTGEILIASNTNHIERALQNGKNSFWSGWFFGIQISNVF